MYISKPNESDRMFWPLDQIQRDFRKAVIGLPGTSAKASKEVLLMFNRALLFVCISRGGKSLARLKGEYCFRVDMRTILRHLPEPASPEVILEAGAGLDLIREYITDPTECLDRISRRDPHFECPSTSDIEDWMRWGPAYLCNPQAQTGDHPWT